MNAEITVTLEGITEEELLHALQSMRDLERTNPERIVLFLMVTAERMTAAQVSLLLSKLQPPLPYTLSLSTSSIAGTSKGAAPWN
jgi:hypothetical protein